tara:strand:- start:21 stop:1094 length:1074 start_codon:yes stop_codon:yes gene_type:complete
LKIAIGYDLKNNSWGGGNQFANSLTNAARIRGDEITFNLKDKDIDLILLTDPRSFNEGITFGPFEILKYILFNNKTIVVHRINECDERKNTFHMNKLLKYANYCSDYTIFISSWLKNLDIYHKNIPSKVIHNGSDEKIFSSKTNLPWNKKEPLKIVTHHWSPNKMKGFDVYSKLDQLIKNTDLGNKIEFTYIGNLPKGFTFKKAKHLAPLSGKALGMELSKNHVYLSASQNEPAGMHHIEGALSGLPIIYRKSGALPEYCRDFGISFDNLDFTSAIHRMILEYDKYKLNLKSYPYTASKMTSAYLNLFDDLILNRDNLIKKRNLLKSPFYLFMNLMLPLLYIKIPIRIFKNFLRKFI